MSAIGMPCDSSSKHFVYGSLTMTNHSWKLVYDMNMVEYLAAKAHQLQTIDRSKVMSNLSVVNSSFSQNFGLTIEGILTVGDRFNTLVKALQIGSFNKWELVKNIKSTRKMGAEKKNNNKKQNTLKQVRKSRRKTKRHHFQPLYINKEDIQI